MDFFYRRFRGSTYLCTPHAPKNDASCPNLTIPKRGAVSNVNLRQPLLGERGKGSATNS